MTTRWQQFPPWIRSRWRRLERSWNLRFRQRVTRAGFAYAFAMILIAVAAFASANNLLFLILAAMMATFLISGFISRLGLAALEMDLLLPRHIPARQPVRAGIRMRNLKPWVPSFSIHLLGEVGVPEGPSPQGPSLQTPSLQTPSLQGPSSAPASAESALHSSFDVGELLLYFPVIPSGAQLDESLLLVFPKRGNYKERVFHVSTRFPFGFAERREPIVVRQDVLVYPCLNPQPGFDTLLSEIGQEVEAQRRGRGTDFYRIRPYAGLESVRHVDWKATAHTGDLQVREFAQDQEAAVLIFLDLNPPASQRHEERPGQTPEHPPGNFTEWFEEAIECAAFLAYELSGRGARVRLRTQLVDVTCSDAGDIYTILKYLALASPAWSKPTVAPDETNSFQVVLTANPDRLRSLGWGSAPAGSRFLAMDGSGHLSPSGAKQRPD